MALWVRLDQNRVKEQCNNIITRPFCDDILIPSVSHLFRLYAHMNKRKPRKKEGEAAWIYQIRHHS